jgi:hypothetical protein
VSRSSNLLSVISLLLLAIALLLVFEVVRPFRNLAIDGPVAVGCMSAGLLLAVAAIWLRRGIRAIAVIALALNAIALVGVCAVIYSLSHMRLF